MLATPSLNRFLPAALTAVIAATLSLAAPCAFADEPAAAPAPAAAASAPLSKGEIKAIKQFHMLDFNGDGKLSKKEVAIVPKLYNAFDEADTNRDGFITLDEVRAYTIKYRAARDKAKADAQAKPSAVPAPTPTPTPATEAADTKEN